MRGADRKYLRGLAHGLKPAVHVGKEGLSEGALAAIDEALLANELIKVRFVANKDEKRDVLVVVEQRLGCSCVGLVGHVAVLYRPHPDPEKRSIELREPTGQ